MCHHVQDIQNKYAPFFQARCLVFSRNVLKDLLNLVGKMPTVFIFDICNVYVIVAYARLYLQYWGRVKMVDMASKNAVCF